ncbi:MAG: hypothetical protein Q4D21_08330 [Phascolarctobacterium sp.]|nr:hypothetical protein [Phascolarctobacterium sp.]
MKYNKQHEKILKELGYNTLEEAQKLTNDEKYILIVSGLLPIVTSYEEPRWWLADELITMIKYWPLGMTDDNVTSNKF